ncbi:hypothetical protein IU429_02885 [Nocardia elegans]|uniref:Uncharacterized protein n=1 Tax=Nocardia elegans TaxID=300029 RepID=A0ABW6TP41_9NOCA|nr:hypothetical protein [Nocardia elegans]MBF6446605.1 hypothetical protein [Nocardia elegans]
MHETFPAQHLNDLNPDEQAPTGQGDEEEFNELEYEPETWKSWSVGRFVIAASNNMKTGMVLQTGGREGGGKYTVSASFSPQDVKALFDLLSEHRDAFETGAAEGLAPLVERGMHVEERRGDPIPRNLHAKPNPDAYGEDDAAV